MIRNMACDRGLRSNAEKLGLPTRTLLCWRSEDNLGSLAPRFQTNNRCEAVSVIDTELLDWLLSSNGGFFPVRCCRKATNAVAAAAILKAQLE
jgi:hypothetical protein